MTKPAFSNDSFRRTAIDYLIMVIGTTLIAAAITVFYEPNHVATGGISGLCIILSAYSSKLFGFELSLSVLNVIFNLPLLVIGYLKLGRSFIWRTVICTLYLSVAFEITKYIPCYQGDYFITAVFGGIILGAGVGLTFRASATTGGSELFAAILHKLKPHIPLATCMFILEAAIIALGFLVFGVESGLYAIISVYISSKVVDNILEGLNYSRGVFIFSKKADEIAEDILKNLDRGVTGLSGKGMYTKKEMNVLLCIVARKEIMQLKNIVNAHDANAFMFVTDVRETLGEGFQAPEKK